MSTLTTHLKCTGCDMLLRKIKGKKKLIRNEDEANVFGRSLQRTIIINDIICNKCRLSIYKKQKPKKESESEIETDLQSFESTSDDPTFEVQFKSKETEIEYVEIPIQRTVATHKYCCICSATENLMVIPEEARMQSYIKKKIYISVGNRCCRTHIIKNRI